MKATTPAEPDANRTPFTDKPQTASHTSTRAVSSSGSTPVSKHTTPVANPAHAALRLLEKPERVVVQVLSGMPRQATWRERRMSFVTAHGPERLSGDWWRPDTFARDYWRCTVAGEGELLLYRDSNGWFVQGWYD